jgi:hypothetical protein
MIEVPFSRVDVTTDLSGKHGMVLMFCSKEEQEKLLPKNYRCIDCNFVTQEFMKMFDHQKHHWRNHTWRQRFNRFFGL